MSGKPQTLPEDGEAPPEGALLSKPLVFHNSYYVECPNPACHVYNFFTDSRAMEAEAKDAGWKMGMAWIEPIQAQLHGQNQKVFPVKCRACSCLSIARLVPSNAEEVRKFREEILPYYPEKTPQLPALKFQYKAATVREFVDEVAAIKNPLARSAVVRRFQSRQLFLPCPFEADEPGRLKPRGQ